MTMSVDRELLRREAEQLKKDFDDGEWMATSEEYGAGRPPASNPGAVAERVLALLDELAVDPMNVLPTLGGRRNIDELLAEGERLRENWLAACSALSSIERHIGIEPFEYDEPKDVAEKIIDVIDNMRADMERLH